MKCVIKLCSVLFITVLLTHSVHGSEYVFDEKSNSQVYPEAEMDELYSSLNDDVQSELDGYFSAEDDAKRTDEIKDKLDFRYIVRTLITSAEDVLTSWVKTLGSMLAVVMISSVMKNTLSSDMSSQFCSGTISLVAAVSAGNVALTSARMAVNFISQLCSVMNAMIPVMSAVMLWGGGVSSASVNSGALMLYITAAENVTVQFLNPLAGAMFALSIFSGIFKGVNISALISGIRKFLMSIFGFSLMIFSFVLGIQTSLASSADSLTMKTVRFALGSYVPFVGGVVSESLSTVTASLAHVRKMTGAVGVIIILLTVLPTLITLFMNRIALLLCKSVAETLECNEVASPLGDAETVLSLFLAFSAMSAVFFIFATVLFMNSGLK